MLRHPTTSPAAVGPPLPTKASKKRGNYNCGRCGLPKRGHTCPLPGSDAPAAPLPPPRSERRLRRALSFEDDGAASEVGDAVEEVWDEEVVEEEGVLGKCLAEVLRRLPPAGLMAAAMVCRGWRDGVRRVWRAAEEVRLRVPRSSPAGSIGSVLTKCSSLVRLSVKMESDVDVTLLACISFSCQNLESLEISISDASVNRITGDELGRFVSDKRCLSSIKMEGCTNLGFLNFSSSSLSTIWLSDLNCLSKMIINCPNLSELSLEFSRQETDSTDLVTAVDSLGRTCPRLRKLHIASVHLSHEVVLALESADLRGLRMLSLVLGSEITDASVAAIVSSYERLELLDLSGSSISDSGIGMICNVLPQSLSRLLLALCPNITSSGIQFAAAQLPLLQLIDCGMTIHDTSTDIADIGHDENNGSCSNSVGDYHQRTPNTKLQPMYQKLIIKHGRLKKLSLWGCSGLDALYLNCPELNDLNLTSCTNLHPERLLLQCPSLEHVHASGCQDTLVGAIQSQILNDYTGVENLFQCKRLADGSKRIQVPRYIVQQPQYEKVDDTIRARCVVHID
ncbi:F-box/LRR-repeat protein 17 [Acorus calamus]|uniref:F-box/LRR-repeat protein 17 n=1 Tax=Acorus calamus TaxID=4465 RepID=A0AAV9ELL9_ACOCL|nr:F-box/LRR-repeat protein 17 [Acorus calamus]